MTHKTRAFKEGEGRRAGDWSRSHVRDANLHRGAPAAKPTACSAEARGAAAGGQRDGVRCGGQCTTWGSTALGCTSACLSGSVGCVWKRREWVLGGGGEGEPPGRVSGHRQIQSVTGSSRIGYFKSNIARIVKTIDGGSSPKVLLLVTSSLSHVVYQ